VLRGGITHITSCAQITEKIVATVAALAVPWGFSGVGRIGGWSSTAPLLHSGYNYNCLPACAKTL